MKSAITMGAKSPTMKLSLCSSLYRVLQRVISEICASAASIMEQTNVYVVRAYEGGSSDSTAISIAWCERWRSAYDSGYVRPICLVSLFYGRLRSRKRGATSSENERKRAEDERKTSRRRANWGIELGNRRIIDDLQ